MMIKQLLLLIIGLTLVACVESTSGSRPKINRYAASAGSGSGTDTTGETDNGSGSGDRVIRPDNTINISADLCSCLNGKPDSIGNCTSFCASHVTSVATIFANVVIGADISLNDKFANRNLKGWCNDVLNTGDDQTSCLAEFDDGVNKTYASVSSLGAKSFQVVLGTSIVPGTNYKLRLFVDKMSSDEIARTKPIDFTRINSASSGVTDPLKFLPVYQYTCINLLTTGTGATLQQVGSTKSFFYYTDQNKPDPIPSSNISIYCHDKTISSIDASDLSRLELIPNAFGLWNRKDPQFGTENNDLIVHNTIKSKLLNEYKITASGPLSYFQPFSGITTGSGPPMGYMLSPFIDSTTNKPYCPNETYYYSSDPLMKVLSEVIGVNTEAIYMGRRDPESFTISSTGETKSAPQVYIFVKESDVSKVWFVIKSGLKVRPTAAELSNTVYFYYPYDTNDPYVMKSHQKLYKIFDTSDASASGTSSTYDKRVGCVPKLSN